jgi:aminotransferase
MEVVFLENLLNKNVAEIEISGIRRFFNMVGDEKDVISLTIGQPDFHTPDMVKEAAADALSQNKTSYTPNAGILPLRKAISAYYDTNYGVSYDPAAEIIVTAGASQAIDITLRTILNPGDEVILPGPIYPGYAPLITLAGAKPVFADTTKDAFKLTKSTLKEHLTDKTKCVVLPYPSNPTGASYAKDELKELVQILKDRDLFILADEIYSELVYDKEHVSIASFKEVKDKTIVVNGVSKSHAMTGFRLGFSLAPKWLSRHLLKVHQYNVSCASSISQYAALEALTNGKAASLQMRDAYGERRDYVYDRLMQMELDVVKPEGAFYFFPKISSNTLNSFQLGIEMVKKGKVALVPGDSFSPLGEGYMRLSYAYNFDTLQEGLNRLEAFLQKK